MYIIIKAHNDTFNNIRVGNFVKIGLDAFLQFKTTFFLSLIRSTTNDNKPQNNQHFLFS